MHLPQRSHVSVSTLALLAVLLVASSSIAAQTPLPLMPLPSNVAPGNGALSIDGGLRIVFEGYAEPRLERAVQRMRANLARETGILYLPDASPNTPEFIIRTSGPSAAVQQLGEDESYHLTVSSEKVLLTAPTPLGILRGLQTFLQLVASSPQGFIVPAVAIEDAPRFPWRGLMLDTGRHFMPLETVHETLDGMEAVKLNVFHWHLSDDQGFRVESKTYPLLQQKGSDGLYYTQDEIRSILAYARDRGIRVIPEFDMPGHATSWFVGYPELASGNGPYRIERKWGVFNPAIDPSRESTYTFLDMFLGEMTALFPDAYFHIGGDECNGKEWDANPRIQQFMRSNHLKDDAALQAYFTSRVQRLVTKRGKITIGWDEVLQPDTPSNVVIQSWRGPESLAEAARRGYRTILSAGYYLDLNESAAQHYAVDPLAGAAAALSPEQAAHILGGEAAMWTEHITPENVGFRIWPRMAAIAERLWSPRDVTDTQSMYERLTIVSRDLAYDGLPFHAASEQMIERLANNGDLSSLKVLAGVIEPPKGYDRDGLRDYTLYTPLNRMVDAVPAESDTARTFNAMTTRIASGHGNQADLLEARRWLTQWRDNDAALNTKLPQSELTTELVPLSLNLSEAAATGLLALDAIEKHQPVSDEIQKAWLASLKPLAAPQAILLDKVIPGIETLVTASVRH